MSEKSRLKAMHEREEGRKNRAYPDPLTGGAPWTIGIGHTGPEVHQGLVWTEQQIDDAYEADEAKADAACRKNFPWYARLNEARRAVLLSMVFQMGIGRSASPGRQATGVLAFVNTLAAMRDERWPVAASGMLNSLWGKQTPNRVRRMARQMETGEWQ